MRKQFADVARLAISDMRKQLDGGSGKKVYKDYVVVLERYMIPFFGQKFITKIDYEELQRFGAVAH